jgi:hypothetical protein
VFNGHVISYPLQLDIRPYLRGLGGLGGVDVPARLCIYNLVGVVRYYPNAAPRAAPGSGHYKAVSFHCVLRRWYEYDDHEVSALSGPPSDKPDGREYLLFYARASGHVF